MTTQPQSGAAMEPTQAEADMDYALNIARVVEHYGPIEGAKRYRQHVASEIAKAQMMTDLWFQAALRSAKRVDVQAAQIDTLRAAVGKAQEDINWMLNNRQFLSWACFEYLGLALVSTTLGGDEKKIPDPLSGAAEEKTP